MPAGPGRRGMDGSTSIVGFVRQQWLSWLLVFAPLSLALDLLGQPQIWVFVTSALAIIPLAALIGRSTEQLANWTGPGLGGFLNATFGNATELIISLVALRSGLFRVVKAGLTGSIMGNILLSLGLAMFAGGWGREKQTFSRTQAGAHAALLLLAAVALVMPALLDLAISGTLMPEEPSIYPLAPYVAVVLLATYLAGLAFSLRMNRSPFTSVSVEPGVRELGLYPAAGLLLVVTIVTAVEADLLVGTLSAVTAALGLTQFFVGVVVVGTLGNAAEYYSALAMSRLNRMDLAMSIAAGSATQIALFVAPVLFLVSDLSGQPMSPVFNVFEIVGVTLAVLAFSIASLDGESNWFEGVELVAVYLVLAIVFYFVPTV